MLDIKVVAFDCDGVLFDTKKANEAYYNEILEYFGKAKLTPEQFSYVHMHTVDKAINSLFQEDEIQKAHLFRKERGYDKFIPLMEIEPTLRFVLERLRLKYKTAIATNRTDTMIRVLNRFNLLNSFDLVVTALDVEKPKPYPDQLIKILKYFNIQDSQLIYIGDSKVDESAAQDNIKFIAYNNNDLRANFHIKSLKDILTILPLS